MKKRQKKVNDFEVTYDEDEGFIMKRISDMIPKPPKSRFVTTGVNVFCKECDSTMSRTGWLTLFGKRECDNPSCSTHIIEKWYNI